MSEINWSTFYFFKYFLVRLIWLPLIHYLIVSNSITYNHPAYSARVQTRISWPWEGVRTSNFTTTTGYFFHYIKNGFLVDHYIENNCLFSSSLLQKSECWKECEKNIERLSFFWFLYFDYLWHKYLWRFGKTKFKLSILT